MDQRIKKLLYNNNSDENLKKYLEIISNIQKLEKNSLTI